MRRVPALLLMLVFSFPLIAPVIASSLDEASLPACCRSNGAHHCMMGGMIGNIPSRFTTVSAKCPYAPFAHRALMLPHAFAAPVVLTATRQAAGPAATIREAETGYRISMDRTRHKRGPPRLLAL